MASARQTWTDSSLLKKKDDTEELLVFGYSCKLFRDDEKALYIDQGKHLIPWMGDDTLKIDRYDVRGTVYDLRPLEPLGGGASDALWSSLSDAERRVEQLCDEERYRALYHNEAEEALYQEEELKRLHKALDPQNSYGQVAYSYDNEIDQDAVDVSASKEASEAADEEDEPFIPPQELDIPVGMVLPERTKLNAIIEKTAAFINTQGPQMEIILKMKQANNPQFSFLSFDCPLHAYYRHLLMAIKTGRYRTKQQRQQQEKSDAENSEHYLHPSLASAATRVELAPSIPSISYKPSADCAYSMLVNKIKDRHCKQVSDESSGPSSPGDETRSKDNATELSKSLIIVPPSDVQVIIDKMASYVIKNGRDFESVVRSKGDVRFAFLDVGDKFHPYYEHKVRVYQGLEAPQNFNQTAPSTNNSLASQKCSLSTLKKKPSPVKSQRPILLPGYEFSDQSSESDEDDATREESSGKPKLAPVSFSIKKPKEAEILKEVKSALPVEEESSEGEVDEDCGTASKSTNSAAESKSIDLEPPNSDLSSNGNPEDEMERLQQLLREKEKQLREQERQRKLSEKRSQDIFLIDAKEKLTATHVTEPLAVQEKTVSEPCDQIVVSIPKVDQVPVKCDKDVVSPESLSATDKNVDEETTNTANVNADELISDITETEIIDLTEETDEAPKVTDTMRLERKRKAAAFLSLIRKEHPLIKNGGSRPTSDSDAASRHSSPSPPRLKRDKTDHGVTTFHEAGIPKTSLMARLAASTHLPRKPHLDKIKVPKGKSCFQRKSESPVKSGKDKEGKSHHTRLKSKKKKESSPLDFEHERSRSRSRSMSYSRSPPYKRRQGEDSDSEQHNSRYHKETKNDHRKRIENNDGSESSRGHTRHRRRYEEDRHNHSHGHGRGHLRGQLQNRSRSHIHGRSHVHGHTHMKIVDAQDSDSDSSD